MAQVNGAAAFSAAATLTCSVMFQRITVTPSNVLYGGLGARGPLAEDSSVLVSGLNDGIYDT